MHAEFLDIRSLDTGDGAECGDLSRVEPP